MASKNLTFDPSAGVPYAANLTIYTGTDFKTTFTVKDVDDVAFDFQGLTTTSVWTGSAQMQKSAGGGIFDVSMGSTATSSLSEGRYEYNVLVSSGASIYNIVNGNILVYTGIASAP